MRGTRHAKALLVLLVLLGIARGYLESSASSENVSSSSLSRASRGAIDSGSYKYLIFPQGSNVQLIYCLTIGSFARPQGIFTLGVTAGLAYELPYRRTLPHRKPAEVYHRRSRRDLYRKLELMLDTQAKSASGRDCVLKALCTAGKRNREEQLASTKLSFFQEILHSVFTFPTVELGEQQSEELDRHYDQAYNSQADCETLFRAISCPWLF